MPLKDAYSYPEYCDIAYNWDRKPECDFIEGCVQRYGSPVSRSILDIACGTGIHLREFARRGYEVLGLDKSKEMVDFVTRRFAAEGLDVKCIRSPMNKFKLDKKYGAAICMLDSFRYLLSDEDALKHLGSVAAALEDGGLYVLDLWMPQGEKITAWEDVLWVQRDKGIKIEARYRQHPGTFDPADNTFEDELMLKVKSPDFSSTVISRAKTRVFFYGKLKQLAQDSKAFECIGRFYNFDFDLKEGYNTFGIRTNIILKKRRER